MVPSEMGPCKIINNWWFCKGFFIARKGGDNMRKEQGNSQRGERKGTRNVRQDIFNATKGAKEQTNWLEDTKEERESRRKWMLE